MATYTFPAYRAFAQVAEALRGLAKVMRVVGVALEATVDWAEGKITGKQLLFRAAWRSCSARPAVSPAR